MYSLKALLFFVRVEPMRMFTQAKTDPKLYTALKNKAIQTLPNRYPGTFIRLLTDKNITLNERIIDEKIWDQTQRVPNPDKIELKHQMAQVDGAIVLAPLSTEFKEELRNFTF